MPKRLNQIIKIYSYAYSMLLLLLHDASANKTLVEWKCKQAHFLFIPIPPAASSAFIKCQYYEDIKRLTTSKRKNSTDRLAKLIKLEIIRQ